MHSPNTEKTLALLPMHETSSLYYPIQEEFTHNYRATSEDLGVGYLTANRNSPVSSHHGTKKRPVAVTKSEFPGWGDSMTLENLKSGNEVHEEKEEKLGEWLATSICGNDITSSCFYCTGLVVHQAGVWAPLCMALVSFTLYLFRKIYGEAVTALPLNGGAYNVLLNTTSKSTASIAACLTILSYIATAVVSAGSAVAYFGNIWGAVHGSPVTYFVILLLVGFACLTLFGITDSARTALVIFILHLTTLTILVLSSVVYLCRGGETNFHSNYDITQVPLKAIYFGFASAMLGVTGFETSANFVEEQADGVFMLTLRNMWGICAFFNPFLALMTIAICDDVVISAHMDDSLAILGNIVGGEWLKMLISVDAFIVLSGSILTAYVGVTGLCRRLAMDRCLPNFLLAENEFRHTNHWIIIGFCGLCSSLYLMLGGKVSSLSNVYTISFLCVMGLFAVGDMLLKYKRNDIPRAVKASWPSVLIGFSLVGVALSGAIVGDPSILSVWAAYFIGTGILMSTMFYRVQILKMSHFFFRKIAKYFGCLDNEQPTCLDGIAEIIQSIHSQPVAFFIKRCEPSVMNKAILYVRLNEDCGWIRMVHVYSGNPEVADKEDMEKKKLTEYVKFLDELYPKIKIDLVLCKGELSPLLVSELSKELSIPKNLMFLGCPSGGYSAQGTGFGFTVSSLGGVRVITH